MTDTFPSHEMMYYYEVPGLEDVFIYPELYTFQYLTWNENCMTMSLNFDYQYQFGKHHSGSISFGFQNGRYHLEDAHNQEGDMGNRVLITYDDFKNLMPGREHMQNAYFQLKHRWHNFIFNAGLRYDRKLRNDDDVLREFSPRVALVFLQPRYDIKLSYSKSFVDAPYFYRNNTLDVYNGSGLDPEYLNSVQFTISGHQLIRGLELELNTFYNKASDLIWSTGYFYANSGVMKSVGLEASASYTRNRLHAHANLEWQYVIDTENYTAKGTHIYNVPRLSSNVTASYQIIKNLIVNANVNILSRQVSHYRLPIEEIIENNKEDIEISIPPRAVFNVGASYKWKNLELGLNAYNLFNRNYEQGGSTIGPIRQQGRWLMFSLAYKFI
jgi:iron complex outermembrane receptor protein